MEVFKKMIDYRVSILPIQSDVQGKKQTIGFLFLNDIMFFFRLNQYHQYLDEPVMKFVAELNNLDEDETNDNSHSLDANQVNLAKCLSP
mmetsp:Transcript_44231/g.42934  ORF Transcript_44231/g.42934 Transcript_44231/m.42934 type:complete len:89 (-) Transcript_44231:498-764(-)